MYDSVLDEGVPDDFEALLSALDETGDDASEPAGKTADKAEQGVSDG
jgi:hypothetical protein